MISEAAEADNNVLSTLLPLGSFKLLSDSKNERQVPQVTEMKSVSKFQKVQNTAPFRLPVQPSTIFYTLYPNFISCQLDLGNSVMRGAVVTIRELERWFVTAHFGK